MRLLRFIWGRLWDRIPKSPWLWIFASAGLGFASGIWFREEIFIWLFIPSGGQLSPFDGLPVYSEPTGALNATIKLGLKTAVAGAIPTVWIVLMRKIKRFTPRYWWWFTLAATLSSVMLALAGGSFVYYAFMPAGLGFVLGFGENYAVPVISLGEYTGLMSSMMLWVMVFFQLPLIMFIFAKMGFLPYFRWRLLRKLWWSMMLILAAFISPGFDPISAIILYVPMVALYEVGLFVAWLTNNQGEDFYYVRTIFRAIVWILRRPIVLARLIERALVRHGLAWWW
mgnify:CR=1 FL=1